MKKQLIEDIVKYVEEMEVNIDGEWGLGRDLEELLADEDEYMPDFYYKLKDMLDENTEENGEILKWLNKQKK